MSGATALLLCEEKRGVAMVAPDRLSASPRFGIANVVSCSGGKAMGGGGKRSGKAGAGAGAGCGDAAVCVCVRVFVCRK